jgi:hypothetical protein
VGYHPEVGPVTIVGDGVAALCCAFLLRKAGVAVNLQWHTRATVPAVMLGDAALHLLREVFEAPAMFAGAHRIVRRAVNWGGGLREFPHAAVVVSEEELLGEIRRRVPEGPCGGDPEWTVHATRKAPGEAIVHGFGAHHAMAVPVELHGDAASCCIEALDAGWRFLIPSGPDRGWLLTAGVDAGEGFPVHPRLADPLSGPGWLACGSGAVAFNPLCGDGTAHAVREAILAAAVLQAMGGEGSQAELMALYSERMAAAFARHLQLCRDFYRMGPGGAWWRTQEAAMSEGMAWCSPLLRGARTRAFTLDGFVLRAVR